MGNPGRITRQIDPDDIESARDLVPVALQEKATGGAGDMLLLPGVDPGLGIAEPAPRTGLHLHEDDFFIVPGNDVYFAAGYGIPVIPGQHGMALAPQEHFRDSFTS